MKKQKICLLLLIFVVIAYQPDINADGQFTVSDGKIYDPDGKLFVAAGLNLYDSSIASQVLNLFPGINHIRCADNAMHPPSYWNSFINTMTAQKVVCQIEYHPWPLISEPPPSNYINWITSVANYYKSNPYVWIGSMNEPQSGDMTSEHVSVYNAVRNAGNDNMILFVGGTGGGNPNQTGPAALNSSSYSAMHRVAWDLHFYGWMTNYSTDVNAIHKKILGNTSDTGIRAVQTIHSSDGVMPVIYAEFGVSTSASRMDANWSQDIDAIMGWTVTNYYSSGYVAWHWNADPYNAVQSGGSLTTWGTHLKNGISDTKTWLAQQQEGPTPTPINTPTPNTSPSP